MTLCLEGGTFVPWGLIGELDPTAALVDRSLGGLGMSLSERDGTAVRVTAPQEE
jgi:hypothetical protein